MSIMDRFTMVLVDPDSIESLGWVLLHTTWQFTIVAALGYLLTYRVQQATVRYNIWMVLLGFLVLTPMLSGVIVHNSISSRLSSFREATSLSSTSTTTSANAPVAQVVAASVEPATNGSPVDPNGPATSAIRSGKVLANSTDSVDATGRIDEKSMLDELPSLIQQWMPTIVTMWAIGVVLGSVRPLLSLLMVARLTTLGLSIPNEQIIELVRRLQTRLNVGRIVEVYESNKVHVPVVVGCMKSVILLPVAMVANFSPLHLEALIAHELAHVKRFDYMVNLVQTILETLFFYHPAIWWISNRIRIERENCCDDMAVKLINNRIEYGRALVALDQWRCASVFVLGANDGSIRGRVIRLLVDDSRRHRTTFSFAQGMLGILLTATAVGGMALAGWKPAPTQDDHRQEKASIDSGLSDAPQQEKPSQENQPSPTAIRSEDHDSWEGTIDWNSLDQLPDVSSVDDPEVILHDLEEGHKLTYIEMTGGMGYHWLPNTAPPIETVARFWKRMFQGQVGDPRVRRLIELGPAAQEAIHARIPTARLIVVIPYSLALGRIGDTESIELLIQSLERMDRLRPPGGMGPREHAPLAVTGALWELTGQKHDFSPQQWRQWWESVKSGYVIARERQSLQRTEWQTAELATALVSLLQEDPEVARDRLIAQGRQMIPHVKEAIKRRSSGTDLHETSPDVGVHLAWVLDELGETKELPAELRRQYFATRFSRVRSEFQYEIAPDEMTAFYRAMNACSFADVCQIMLDATRINPHSLWPIRYELISRKFHFQPVHMPITPPINYPGRQEIEPTADPVTEMAGAVAVLVTGLKDQQAAVRLASARLAEMIAFSTDERPAGLISVLAEVWLAEADPQVRYQAGFAMARFSTPLVLKTFSDALRSDRPEIVSDAVGYYDWIQISLNANNRSDFELIQKFTEADDDKLRTRAVRALKSRAPEFLFSEIDRLARDPVDDIRTALTHIQIEDCPPEFVEAMFVLATDSREPIRTQAISRIGSMQRPELIPRLRPFLSDQQVWGWAASAIVESSPERALPVLMEELQGGNDIGGMVYQHLERITGQMFAREPLPWLEWWRKKTIFAADLGS